MLKRILTAACALALAAGCSGTREGTSTSSGSTSGSHGSTSGGTGSGSTSGGTTGTSAGTTGSTTGSACTVTSIADARSLATPAFSTVCFTDVVTTFASHPGNQTADGGTQFDGKWYVVDPVTNEGIYVFKSRNLPPRSFDPERGSKVDVVGKVQLFPSDAGIDAQVEIATSALDFTDKGQASLPTPQAVAVTALAPSGSDESAVGKYVTVPAGTYTQDNAAPEMHTGNFQDGVKLTDSSGNSILVDTFEFKHTSNNCIPNDGGFPDLTAGGFNGMFDHTKTPSGARAKVLFYGHCGQ